MLIYEIFFYIECKSFHPNLWNMFCCTACKTKTKNLIIIISDILLSSQLKVLELSVNGWSRSAGRARAERERGAGAGA